MNGSFCVCSRNEICFNFHFIFALCSRNKEHNFFLLIKLHSSKSVDEKNTVAFPSFRNCIHRSFSWCCWSFDVWCFQLHYIKLFSVTCKQTQRKRKKSEYVTKKKGKDPKPLLHALLRSTWMHSEFANDFIAIRVLNWKNWDERRSIWVKKKWATTRVASGKKRRQKFAQMQSSSRHGDLLKCV